MPLLQLQILSLFLFGWLLGKPIEGYPQSAKKPTGKAVNVPGTRVSMVPPPGFILSGNFAGFQDEASGSSIMVITMPTDFKTMAASMDKTELTNRGILVEQIDSLTISELPALFVTGTQKAYGLDYTKYMLLLGNEDETVIINAASPVDKKSVAKTIKDAMHATTYAPDLQIDPLEHVDFTLNTQDTPFQFSKSVANSLIYTTDGHLPPQSEDKSTLIVAKSFFELSVEHRKEFAHKRLNDLPIKIDRITSTDSLVLDDLQGFEVLAEGHDEQTGLNENILLTIIFGEDFYYLFVGTAHKGFEGNLISARQVVASFRRKK